MPRASAMRARVDQVDALDVDRPLEHAGGGRREQRRRGAGEVGADAQREALHRPHAAVGEDRARDDRGAARDGERVLQLLPVGPVPAPATLMERDSSPWSSASRTASQASTATLRCASAVEAPRCGVRNAFGVARSGWSAASGSLAKASTTAPRELSALQRREQRRLLDDAAAREVHDDRAALASGRARACRSSPCVSSVSGVCTVRTSASSSSSSSVGGAPHAQCAEALVAHVRIVAGDVHAEGVRARRDLAADAPERRRCRACVP